MKVKKEFILKSIANQYVVVPVGNEAVNFNGMLTLNKTAKLLYEALAEEKSVEDLVLVLTDTYDISEEFARRDVLEFIKTLESKNVLE
jgi:hypothetical protein